ncbi:hypothetical protein DB32_002511 [Sandaracinus amylolyticus]|uniref:Uncharacterized protein n=1 Tax=Sandaracinus amylolyticus TaxID=927083 RepID=A0A0F6W1V7_9BACT|nr:hypothetical protein DB32_002511 [Sandaracinus amylolyticus]
MIASAALLVACGGATNAGSTTPVDAPRRECTAALRFAEPEVAQTSDEEMPRTAIALALICEDEPIRTVAIGTEVGACFNDEASDGALLRARCWWAGQGAIVVVRRNGEVLEVLRADVDEHTGAGALERVTQLEIPANHVLHTL